ncbi:MAG: excinuclease ABC subunit UvrC [Nitrospirota bacterium]|nr:excinuclease ABC subunit UvrC [Nitrospirota bacterium]
MKYDKKRPSRDDKKPRRKPAETPAPAKPHKPKARPETRRGSEPSLQDRLKTLPDQPGVYLMKDARGHIIYVGKAKNLKNRVRSYFQSGKSADYKTQALVQHIADLEFIVTASELEAFILENTLIKKHKPRYNIILRDDKNYPYLQLTVIEDFPRLKVVRKLQKDGNLYFGPYVPATPMRQTLDVLNRYFMLRKCDLPLTESSVKEQPRRPCLNHQLGLSPAPCAGLVSKEEYRKTVEEVRLFLQGKKRELLDDLRSRMDDAAREMRFEEAAKLRDRLRAIEKLLESQRVVSTDLKDQDIVGFIREGSVMSVQVIFVRNGMIMGRKDFLLEELDEPDNRILSGFLGQFYGNEVSLPEEVMLPVEIEEQEVLQDMLTRLRGKKVEVIVPQRGKKLDMVEMARENARLSLLAHRASIRGGEKRAAELQKELRLRKLPLHVECFDISNLQGREPVASLVVFKNGMPVKTEYRHFGIKTVEGSNDFASMGEVVFRRYKRLLEEGRSMPDLIVIDGGRGQLGAALESLDRLGIVGQQVVGLAKARTKDKGKKTDFERVYLPGDDFPTPLEPTSAACHLMQRIRDEAHRFALSYHQKLRERKTRESALDAVPGIGEQRKKDLLKHFGSVRRIMTASVEELAKAPGISGRLAAEIKERLASTERKAG